MSTPESTEWGETYPDSRLLDAFDVLLLLAYLNRTDDPLKRRALPTEIRYHMTRMTQGVEADSLTEWLHDGVDELIERLSEEE